MSLTITDQALLRHLERVAGVDVTGIRADLEARFARAHRAAQSLESEEYAIRYAGHQYIVRGDKVTTVLPPMSAGARFSCLEPQDE